MTKEKPIIIIGKSSHSKVIKEAALVSGRLIYKILDFKKINSRFLKTNKENFDFIVAIGDNKLRKIIFNKLKKKIMQFYEDYPSISNHFTISKNKKRFFYSCWSNYY